MLQYATGVATPGKAPRTIKGAAGNQRAMGSTVSQRSYRRQMDAFARDFARPGRKNRYVKGAANRPARIVEGNFILRPQRLGTISQSAANRANQKELRADLKKSGQSSAQYRAQYRKGRRYSRTR